MNNQEENETKAEDPLEDLSDMLSELLGGIDEYLKVIRWRNENKELLEVKLLETSLKTGSLLRIKFALANLALKYDELNGNQPRVIGENSIKTILDSKRILNVVKKDSADGDDLDQIDFSYTEGNCLQNNPVPELLSFYPSESTIGFLFNDLSELLLDEKIKPLSQGEVREIKGILGQYGQIPIRIRLLNQKEREESKNKWTTGVPEDSDIILVDIPDTNGYFACEPESSDYAKENFPKSLWTKNHTTKVSDIQSKRPIPCSLDSFYICLSQNINYLRSIDEEDEEDEDSEEPSWATIIVLLTMAEEVQPEENSKYNEKEFMDIVIQKYIEFSLVKTIKQWVRDQIKSSNKESLERIWCIGGNKFTDHCRYSNEKTFIEDIEWERISHLITLSWEDCISEEKTIENRFHKGVWDEANSKNNPEIQEEPSKDVLDNLIDFSHQGLVMEPLLKYQEQSSDDINSSDKPVYFYNKGVEKEESDDYEEAIVNYSKAIELDSKDPSLYIRRANLRKELEDYLGSIEDYDNAIRLVPNCPIYYLNRGVSKGCLDEDNSSIDDYNKAIEIDPAFSCAFLNRGIARNKIKDYQGSLEDLNEAISISPESMGANIYIYRGFVKLNLGEVKEACIDWRTASAFNFRIADQLLEIYCTPRISDEIASDKPISKTSSKEILDRVERIKKMNVNDLNKFMSEVSSIGEEKYRNDSWICDLVEMLKNYVDDYGKEHPNDAINACLEKASESDFFAAAEILHRLVLIYFKNLNTGTNDAQQAAIDELLIYKLYAHRLANEDISYTLSWLLFIGPVFALFSAIKEAGMEEEKARELVDNIMESSDDKTEKILPKEIYSNQSWDPAVGMNDNQRTKTNYKELAAALALLLLFFLGIGAGFVYLRNQSEKSNQNQASVLINQIFEK